MFIKFYLKSTNSPILLRKDNIESVRFDDDGTVIETVSRLFTVKESFHEVEEKLKSE